jgi:hypothetical protein
MQGEYVWWRASEFVVSLALEKFFEAWMYYLLNKKNNYFNPLLLNYDIYHIGSVDPDQQAQMI